MNIEQAKQIKIEDFLSGKNIFPDKKRKDGTILIYKAPYRNENKASLEVDTLNNRWYDYADAKGGDLLNLIALTEQTDCAGALMFLTSGKLTPFSFPKQNNNDNQDKEPSIQILKVKELSNVGLLAYIQQRKINNQIAKKYLNEIDYKIKTKNGYAEYFAVGFKNDKDGYELRNKYFQGCTSKYFTTVPGSNKSELNIFEGFFDFLAALTYTKTLTLKYDSLVLNSVALKNQAATIIEKYSKVNLFLDNDNAGAIAAAYFQSQHQHTRNYSIELYPNYKDFNEFLLKQVG